MIDNIIIPGIVGGAGGLVGGAVAALLIDRIEISRLANLMRRITRLEGYYGAAVSKDNRTTVGAIESAAVATAVKVLADKNMTSEQKQQTLLDMGTRLAESNPNLLKKVIEKGLTRFM